MGAGNVMDHILIHHCTEHAVHVNAVVIRRGIALIALDERAAAIAGNLDTVMAVAIAYPVVQKLRPGAAGPEVKIGILELVVEAVITVSRIVNVGILDGNTGRPVVCIDKSDAVELGVPAFKAIDRDIGHDGTLPADAPLPEWCAAVLADLEAVDDPAPINDREIAGAVVAKGDGSARASIDIAQVQCLKPNTAP